MTDFFLGGKSGEKGGGDEVLGNKDNMNRKTLLIISKRTT